LMNLIFAAQKCQLRPALCSHGNSQLQIGGSFVERGKNYRGFSI
jgi:hypothetical protein